MILRIIESSALIKTLEAIPIHGSVTLKDIMVHTGYSEFYIKKQCTRLMYSGVIKKIYDRDCSVAYDCDHIMFWWQKIDPYMEMVLGEIRDGVITKHTIDTVAVKLGITSAMVKQRLNPYIVKEIQKEPEYISPKIISSNNIMTRFIEEERKRINDDTVLRVLNSTPQTTLAVAQKMNTTQSNIVVYLYGLVDDGKAQMVMDGKQPYWSVA